MQEIPRGDRRANDSKIGKALVDNPQSEVEEKGAETEGETEAGTEEETAPAFTNSDVGKEVSIEGDAVKIDGELRYIEWSDAKHHNCSGKIKSVEEKYKGRVHLEDGQEFENPADTRICNHGLPIRECNKCWYRQRELSEDKSLNICESDLFLRQQNRNRALTHSDDSSDKQTTGILKVQSHVTILHHPHACARIALAYQHTHACMHAGIRTQEHMYTQQRTPECTHNRCFLQGRHGRPKLGDALELVL